MQPPETKKGGDLVERLIALGIVLAIMVIGFLSKYVQLKNNRERIDFCTEYKLKFIDLINRYTSSYSLDGALYTELTEKAARMQQELGSDGLVEIVDNLNGIKARNYPVLLNFLPELRNFDFWQDNTIMQHRLISLARTCEDAFTRHIGQLNHLQEQGQKYLFNPFSCFANGIRWLLWLPSNILLWCGFISEDTGLKLQFNWVIKILTLIITIIGLLSSVMTIALGWDEFYGMLAPWLIK